MEQVENSEQKRVDDNNESNGAKSDIEKQLPATMVEKSSEPAKVKKKKKKKKKMSNGNGSPPPQSHSKKRKIPRDADAPKYPKTGYVRFTTERRDILKVECPEMSVLDVTKKMADEWNNMPEENKKPYLEAAEEDKDRYRRETKEYNKKMELANMDMHSSSPEKPKKKLKRSSNAADKSVEPIGPVLPMMNSSNATSNTRHKVLKTNSIMTPPPSPPPYAEQMVLASGEIPIFTDQFLEHNRQVEVELKKMRKLNLDYEHQNSVLEKHVENIQNGIGKLTNETNTLVEENQRLKRYLDNVRQKLSKALSGLAIPTEPNGADSENIDKFMNDLHEMVRSNSHGPASLNKAKDILRKIDFNIGDSSKCLDNKK